MKSGEDIARFIHRRIVEMLSLEEKKAFDQLQEFIDPAVRLAPDDPICRKRRDRQMAFLDQVKTASLDNVSVEAFIEDGGKVYGGRPVAYVRYLVRYNGDTRGEFFGPWVEQGGMWFTRATGKNWPSSPPPK